MELTKSKKVSSKLQVFKCNGIKGICQFPVAPVPSSPSLCPPSTSTAPQPLFAAVSATSHPGLWCGPMGWGGFASPTSAGQKQRNVTIYGDCQEDGSWVWNPHLHWECVHLLLLQKATAPAERAQSHPVTFGNDCPPLSLPQPSPSASGQAARPGLGLSPASDWELATSHTP